MALLVDQVGVKQADKAQRIPENQHRKVEVELADKVLLLVGVKQADKAQRIAKNQHRKVEVVLAGKVLHLVVMKLADKVHHLVKLDQVILQQVLHLIHLEFKFL